MMAKQLVTGLPDVRVKSPAAETTLSEEDQLRLYRIMVKTRCVDERMVTLQRQGRIGFYIGSLGEEAAIVGSAFALQPSDWLFPCYRELGAAFVRGFTLNQLVCQLFGNSADDLKGRQMPNHYADVERKIMSISSPVGTQIPQATGFAWAAKIRGDDLAVLVYFGDGATSEGDFHVALNFAGVFHVPVIFFCRNNQWAISVPRRRQTASKSIAVKAKAYGFEGVTVDGNDLLAVYDVTQKAVKQAHSGGGPTLIEAVTYRQGAHSTSDDPRGYRGNDEVEEWKSRDPVTRFRHSLEEAGIWDEKKESNLRGELKTEILAAIREAEGAPAPPLESLFDDVYARRPWHLEEQCRSLLTLSKHSDQGTD